MQIALNIGTVALTVGAWSILTALAGDSKMTDEQAAARAELDGVTATALAEYWRVTEAALAEYERVRAATWATAFIDMHKRGASA